MVELANAWPDIAVVLVLAIALVAIPYFGTIFFDWLFAWLEEG